jgi:chemotaxis regulatin CheY-phosphate phosphatase CheZ
MENGNPQTLPWRESVKALRAAFRDAKLASSKLQVRDRLQMIYCMHISKSETARQLAYDVAPVAERFQEELAKLNEHWATTLEIQVHHLMRELPVV